MKKTLNLSKRLSYLTIHGPNLCIIMSTVESKLMTDSIILLAHSLSLTDLNKLDNVS